ncbi:MAG: 2-amino-4-hydroxy-6-hydroxymethyldihydropteridine diphosphokinase [Gammaproteobacteria bacterium]|jgi:2-amino-4-hydroxy-6-hydroxymethyldihydropteridine diphosphokinase
MVTKPHWVPAYIGLGSNLENPAQQVRAAIDSLAELPGTRLIARSALYANPPMGPQDQPDYVNAAAGLLTRLAPLALLGELQGLEQRQGRVRKDGDRWGPRVIDLDLLVYGTVRESVPGLDLPHSGIMERNFVLFPLRDIAPQLNVPGQGIVAALAAKLDDADLRRVDKTYNK